MQKRSLKKIKIIAWLMVVMTISPVFLDAQIQRFSFHSLTTDEGLSQSSNDFIYHDSQGFVWLSSLDGLNRFDGKNVKIYKSIAGDSTSLLGNNISSTFFEDSKNNLWFTTHEGLHCYLREQDHFLRFQLTNKSGKTLQEGYHLFHLDNQGQLWIRIGSSPSSKLHIFNIHQKTAHILCSISGQRHTPILDATGQVQQILTYYFSMGYGMEILELTPPFNRKSYFKGDTAKNPKFNIKQIHIAAKNEWYLSDEKQLVRFHPLSETHQSFNQYKGQAIGRVFSNLSINDSTLLVASKLQGLLLFNKKQQQFTKSVPHEPEKKLGLQLKQVNNIYKDKQENIWLSSTSSGVNYANINKQKFDLPNTFSDQHIIALFESSKGERFCSHLPDGMTYFSKKTAQPSLLPALKNELQIQFFLEDTAQNIWGFTFNTLVKWQAESQNFVYIQDLPSTILYAYKSQSGNILIATYSGIYEWTMQGFVPFQAIGQYQKNLVTAIYEDTIGQLYLAVDASNLLILAKKEGQYQLKKEIESIGYAKSFYEQDSLLWVATSTGVLKIDTENLAYQLLNEPKDGLPTEHYYSILPDETGNFWLSSNKGIIRYNPSKKIHHRFKLSDGLQGNEYNTNAYLKTMDGELWMGGTKGLNRFFPQQIQQLTHLPKVQLIALQVNDTLYEKGKYIGALKNLELPYKNNTFTFNFVALEYSDPENTTLQYQLKNYESSWVSVGTNGLARYANVPPGNYTFQVKAANSDGLWNEVPRSIKLHILTPWWKSWWFYALCFLAVVGVVYGIFLYRLQQALKIERLRVKISSDLHDDVGGLLSGLAMQSELLEMTAAEERKPKLQRISELSRSAMSRMRDTVWAIDARKDKLENLIDRIREHASETLSPKNIQFTLEVEAIALDKALPIQVRQNIYLICKEAITNTAKHSNGDKMQIQFTKSARKGMRIWIHDNGNCIEEKHKSTGLGMSNMQLRAAQLGGRLKIDHRKGFSIYLMLPSWFSKSGF